MAQEKQNSVRILQTKPKKTAKKSFVYILLGCITVIILICALIFGYILYKPTSVEHSDNTENKTELLTELSQNSSIDNDAADYKNQVNDQELSGLFQHQKANAIATNEPQKAESSSPFDTFFGHEKKAAPVTHTNSLNKPAPLQKPAPQLAHTTKVKTKNSEAVVKPSLLDKLDRDKELENPLSDSQHDAASPEAKEE